MSPLITPRFGSADLEQKVLIVGGFLSASGVAIDIAPRASSVLVSVRDVRTLICATLLPTRLKAVISEIQRRCILSDVQSENNSHLMQPSSQRSKNFVARSSTQKYHARVHPTCKWDRDDWVRSRQSFTATQVILNNYHFATPQIIFATGYRKSFPFLADYHNG